MTIFFVVNILIAFISQTVGLLIGAVFADDFTSAVYAAGLVTAPLLLFTGFLVPFRDMRPFLYPLSYISWFKYAMEALVISTYGFDRCQQNNTSSYGTAIESMSKPVLPNMSKMMELFNVLAENDLFADAIWFLNRDVIDQMKLGGSLIMKFFDLDDSQLIPSLAALTAFMIVIRFFGYFLLLWKVNANK